MTADPYENNECGGVRPPPGFGRGDQMDDSSNNAPATKQDLERVVETMREIGTHMVTAFRRSCGGHQARLHDVESSQYAMKVRVAALEERVLELEARFRPKH